MTAAGRPAENADPVMSQTDATRTPRAMRAIIVDDEPPARERLRGKRVAAIVCGANIDEATYAKLIS